MDRGHDGATTPRHRLRDDYDYDGIARWLERKPLAPWSSET
jgi:hypothetical protein